MMPADKMRPNAFDSESLMTLSLLGELELGSYMMGVFKSGQAMGKRSRIEENGERITTGIWGKDGND
jgi:hypothetical protein